MNAASGGVVGGCGGGGRGGDDGGRGGGVGAGPHGGGRADGAGAGTDGGGGARLPGRAPAGGGRAGQAVAYGPSNGLRGVHVLALAAIVLAAVAVRATEFYTTRYQSLPVLDWLESRPPLAESATVPAADDLARGAARVLPLLTIRDDARTRLPEFGPPALVQRTIGGVRDASRIVLGTPGTYTEYHEPVRVQLDTIVFDRALRATAWSELMGREMDVRDPESGQYQARVAGPDEPDGIWIGRPDQAGGVATVAGHRGSVGFVFQVMYTRAATTNDGDTAKLTDLSARAEVLARQGATDWTAWLVQQLPPSPPTAAARKPNT